MKFILKMYNSRFVKFELPSGLYEVIDIKNTLTDLVKIKIVTDDITTKTRLNTNNNSILDGKSFFNILLGVSPPWDYKSDQIYFSEKIININPIEKSQLKCNCINGSILNVARESKLYSFNLDKPPGYKVYFEPETIH